MSLAAINMSQKPLTYADAGVSIAAGNALVKAIAPLAKATARPGADAELGGFGGFFDLKAAGYRDPLQDHALKMRIKRGFAHQLDDAARRVGSVAAGAPHYHAVEPMAREDRAHDTDVAAVRAQEWRVVDPDDIGERAHPPSRG